MALPSWVEDRIRELGEWSLDDQARAWQSIAVIGEIVDLFPPRSQERKEAMSLIAEVARRKKATQLLYARLWRVIKDGAGEGEPRIPQNIDPSTARCIVQHGGGYDVLMQADAEGWTLAQARAWAADKAVTKSDKPPTLWRHLTKLVSPELRKATGPVVDGELIQQVREAVRVWNGQLASLTRINE